MTSITAITPISPPPHVEWSGAPLAIVASRKNASASLVSSLGQMGDAAGYASVRQAIEASIELTRDGNDTAGVIAADDGTFLLQRLGTVAAHEYARDMDPLPQPMGLRDVLNHGNGGWVLRMIDPKLVAIVDGGFNAAHPDNNGVVVHAPGMIFDDQTAQLFTPRASRERNDPGSVIELPAPLPT